MGDNIGDIGEQRVSKPLVWTKDEGRRIAEQQLQLVQSTCSMLGGAYLNNF